MKDIAKKISIIDDIAYQTNPGAQRRHRGGARRRARARASPSSPPKCASSPNAARSLREIGELAGGSVDLADKRRHQTVLAAMVPSIRKTSELVQEIGAASAEQSEGVGQITSA
ncbi:MAG: hypothetical protein U1F25_18740 [Rubrivivax sp.]